MLRLEKLLLGTNKKPWWESRKIIPQQASSLLQSLGGPERLLPHCNWGYFYEKCSFYRQKLPKFVPFNFAQQSKESCIAVSNLSMIIHSGEGVEVAWIASFQVATDSKATSLPLVALFQRTSLGGVVKLRHRHWPRLMGGHGEMVSHLQPPAIVEKRPLRAQLGSRTWISGHARRELRSWMPSSSLCWPQWWGVWKEGVVTF